MTIVNWVLHGGQTGVDRGAWAGVTALESKGSLIKVGGVCPNDFKDERGIIPINVRKNMRPCERRGYFERTKDNILLASALLVIVQDKRNPNRTPGTAATLEFARSRAGLQVLVAQQGDYRSVRLWLECMPPWCHHQGASRDNAFYLMVAGPRASLWPDAEGIAAEILAGALA